ncbi:MAG: lysophospholipid acyltransferase family protein [Granulosicoccaceae bacterium]
MAESPSSLRSPPLQPATWPSWIAAWCLTLVSVLPAMVRNAIAKILAKLFSLINNSNKRVFDINLQACFPELVESERQAFYVDHLAALVQTAFLLPRQWWKCLDRMPIKTQIIDTHYVDQVKASGRQVILLTSHTVALDSGLWALAPLYPLEGIYKPFENPVLEYLVMRGRMRFGAEPHARGGGLRALLKKLSAGAIMVYLSDEDLGTQGSVFAPFYGHQKATLAMLPRLARRSGAAVVPMYSFYDAKADTVKVQLLAPIDGYPAEDDIQSATLMNAAIEQSIALCPKQYLWKMRLFRSCPNGGISRYQQVINGDLTPQDI